MEGERTPDVLPAVPTAMPQPPPVPTSHYSRKPRQPQWLVAGIEQREAEEALKKQWHEQNSYGSGIGGGATTSSVGSMPRIVRVRQEAPVVNKRVSKQEMVPLPALRADRIKALADALNLSPRLLTTGGPMADLRAQLLLDASLTSAHSVVSHLAQLGGYVGGGEPQLEQLGGKSLPRRHKSGALTDRPSVRAAADADADADADAAGVVSAVVSAAAPAAAPAVALTTALTASTRPAALRSKLAEKLKRVIDLFRAADTKGDGAHDGALGAHDGALSSAELCVAVQQTGLVISEAELSAFLAELGLRSNVELSLNELHAALRKMDSEGLMLAPALSGPTRRRARPSPHAQHGATAEGKAIATGLDLVRNLVGEHEQLRHALRRQQAAALSTSAATSAASAANLAAAAAAAERAADPYAPPLFQSIVASFTSAASGGGSQRSQGSHSHQRSQGQRSSGRASAPVSARESAYGTGNGDTPKQSAEAKLEQSICRLAAELGDLQDLARRKQRDLEVLEMSCAELGA